MVNDPGLKACASCGVDVSRAPRAKDKNGRYLCSPCLDRLQARRRTSSPAEGAIPLAEDDGGLMAGLIGSSRAANAPPCTQCGAGMSPGAVVCVQCGYHHGTGAALATNVGGIGPAPEATADPAERLSVPGGWLAGSLMGAALGGVLGGLVWYAISRATGFEIGWIAIGVGFAAGIGAAAGSRGNEGVFTGLVAAAVALLAIGVAKYQVAAAEYDDFVGRHADEAFAKEVLAGVIQAEAGTSTRVRPFGRRRWGSVQTNRMSDAEAADAAEEVWTEEMTQEDREEFLATLAESQSAMRDDPVGSKMESLKAGIGIFDYLFGFLAVAAALGAGSGGELGFGDD